MSFWTKVRDFISGGSLAGRVKNLIDDEDGEEAPTPVAEQDTGALSEFDSVETQAARRRLARLSRYFTSPSGVLDTSTGTSGTF